MGFVAGIGTAHNTIDEVDYFERRLVPPPLPPPTTTLRELTVSKVIGVFGVEGTFPLTRHVAIGPTFRTWAYSPSPKNEYSSLGDWTIHVALAITIR